jgi:putative spermidine/putrescine transport system ATP-binding protein
MAFLEIKNVSKMFGDMAAVKDFNLDVEKGELVTFLGPSGCGKTTTCAWSRLYEPSGPDRSSWTARTLPIALPIKRDVGMVFQAYALRT